MQNPYEVLGIREGAGEEEIKAAYRDQVKKYHPDLHQNNPLYELAEQKLQEINEAYEYLMRNAGCEGQKAASKGNSNGTEDYIEVRKYIDHGNLMAAEAILNRSDTRGAEWHFLYGMLSLKKGWYNEAINSVQAAVNMDPGNFEYRTAMNNLLQASSGYRTNAYSRGYSSGNDELCRMLQCYCCADLLCDCI